MSQSHADSRAFRGLFLIFALTFVNFVGILLTVTALGGLEPWTTWQFLGLFGVVELSAGTSNIIAPNIWHLPAAEMGTSKRTRVQLSATALLLPHWGAAGRAAAGFVLVLASGFHEGWSIESILLVPLVGGLIVLFLGVSAAIARAGVAHPETDVVEFSVRWRGRENKLQPLSLSASVQQFVLGVLTLPAVKILQPGALFGPEIRPSYEALAITLTLAAFSVAAAALLWAGRLQWKAPSEQQKEAEAKA
jgi:hypothetical protein